LGAIPSAAEYDYPVNSEIQMDSMIEWLGRSTWRP
jgi:hypothetical protein